MCAVLCFWVKMTHELKDIHGPQLLRAEFHRDQGPCVKASSLLQGHHVLPGDSAQAGPRARIYFSGLLHPCPTFSLMYYSIIFIFIFYYVYPLGWEHFESLDYILLGGWWVISVVQATGRYLAHSGGSVPFMD